MVKYIEPNLDATFGALADPTRRAILTRLADGEAAVGQLAEPFDMSLPAITKHLNVLQRAGLISRQKDGRLRRCRLRPERLTEATAWIEETRAFWDTQLDALNRYLDTADAGEPPRRKPPPSEMQ